MQVAHRSEPGPQQLLRWLAAAGVLVVLLVTTTSALLRLSAAGLGCEDWPACYGRAAELQGEAQASRPSLTRLLRRLGGAAAGAVVLGIGLLALSDPRRHRRELMLSGVLALTALGLALLGRATPSATIPAVAIGNVLGGMLMASVLGWLALGARRPRAPAPRWLTALSWAALASAFLAVALGVWTSASYSGLACPGLPLCEAPSGWSAADLDPLRPAWASPGIHFAHRVAGAVAALLALVLAARLWRGAGTSRRIATLLGGVLLAQLLLGIGLVLAALPLPLAVLHNVGAALLLLALVAAHHDGAGLPEV